MDEFMNVYDSGPSNPGPIRAPSVSVRFDP